MLLLLAVGKQDERARQHLPGVVLQDVASEGLRLHFHAGTLLGQQLAHYLLNRSICG